MSLKNGVMPYALKVAVLKPLLKKQDADFEQLKNFWFDEVAQVAN